MLITFFIEQVFRKKQCQLNKTTEIQEKNEKNFTILETPPCLLICY